MSKYELDYIGKSARRANRQASDLRGEATLLEARAAKQRQMAVKRQMDEFELSTQRLIEAWKSGRYSDADLLRAQLEMRAADPILTRLDDEPSVDEMVERFKMLTPGTPVVGLGDGQFIGESATGIVTAAPTHFRVVPTTIYRNDDSRHFGARMVNASYSPSVSFDVALRVVDRPEDDPRDTVLEAGSEALRYGTIGREAIAQMVAEARFNIEEDSFLCHHATPTNGNELCKLRAEIDGLYKLGMKEIDTLALDDAIFASAQYDLEQQAHDRAAYHWEPWNRPLA